ncbi:hypothetical protein HSACCH_02543 [Halanaerobium saccharolyticum subsp. saccharolyticum DSM 6643]|uniref:O-antigen ligase-related domain-containing protein n=1 Tax=Halanaerobium saccharolyticum subsp. saccharolyticum DSM 6643 TaxID=1293054 RepID=M5E474_9FIRM|nr:O-antigen ligase family protein [Halanaerobium saccharolyticum]CCU81050.1 hypothetical protein HSACCH_02543 [Halanaerobium saccharolyticum subsp. saccharolyticum DSM 6643]
MDIKKVISNKIDYCIIVSIYLTCFSIFISNAAINIGSILTILFWLIKIILKDKIISSYDFKGFLIPMSIFTLSIFISGLNNWNNEILSNKFMFSFLFFFIFINEIKNKKEVKIIISLLMASSIIASIYGLYQYYFLDYARIKAFSFSLTFGNLIAVMVTTMIIYIFWSDLNKRTKIILFLINFIFVLNLIFSKSRGAWLAFIVGIFVLGLIKSRKLIVLFLVFLTILFLVMPPQYTNRFKSSFDISYDFEENSSNAYRIAMWKTAIDIIKDNPVIGLGYDNYRTPLSDKYKVDEIKPKGYIHVHNTFLQFGSEIGLFGLFSFLYLMYFTLKKVIIFYKEESKINVKIFHLSTIIMIVIYLVQGLTQYNFGKTEPLSFFWVVIALSIVLKNSEYDELSNLSSKSV